MSLDYASYTKRGFLLGIALVGLGVLGSTMGPSLAGPLPGWEKTMLFDTIWFGAAVGFVSVFGFGIFLPLTD